MPLPQGQGSLRPTLGALRRTGFFFTGPTHIHVQADRNGLQKDSIVLLEQIRTLDKRRLRERMGRLSDADMRQVDQAISVSFGLPGGRRGGPDT